MTVATHLSLEQLRPAVEKALRQWQDADAAAALSSLTLFQKFQRTSNPRQAANDLLLAGLQVLEAEKPRLANLLRLRFLNYITVDQTAHQLGLEEPTIYALQREAFARLTHLLWQQETAARVERQHFYAQRLAAPTYTTLVGSEPHLAQLTNVLTQAKAPWLIAIEGIGGIGKTSLAHVLVRSLLGLAVIGEVAWITARPPELDLGGGLDSLRQPALSSQGLIQKLVEQLGRDEPFVAALPIDNQLAWLQGRLKAQPHLIVIDNLETLLDMESLLPLLQQLSDPTRFLLTSREHVASTGLYHFTVPELSEQSALQLVRQEAEVGNLANLVVASDDELRPIYATVGGNPLALRLVVGQTHTDSLNLILEDLVQARGAKVEQLYTHIYRRAWDKLEEPVRHIWLALPLLIAQQATASVIATLCDQPLDVVRAALDRLVRLNLVNCQGGLNQRQYSLHNLTRTFLQEQVAQWH